MRNNNTIFKTLLVAISLCLFCSAVISFTAINLRDIQEANVRFDQQKKILASANLLDDEKTIEELFLSLIYIDFAHFLNFNTTLRLINNNFKIVKSD